mmetsp:Transcript_36473/g.84857  ORF Transcript_36473/g.84857 Transcript_36473/m.84857 type:complete len:104 (+) Transcript_36473:81-392(+)
MKAPRSIILTAVVLVLGLPVFLNLVGTFVPAPALRTSHVSNPLPVVAASSAVAAAPLVAHADTASYLFDVTVNLVVLGALFVGPWSVIIIVGLLFGKWSGTGK